jgi:DNA-binding MarR family transcriptional regulator
MHLLRQVRARDTESALTAARLSALSTLVRQGPLSVGELAAAEQVTAPTMSRLVTALEREAYVSREPDGADSRRIQVVATESGVRALVEARRRRVERLASLLDALPAERREAVLDATSILETVLEEAVP